MTPDLPPSVGWTSAGIATAICWGVVIVVWIAGAVYGARSRARHQGIRTGVIWQLGSFIAAVLVFRLALHELERVTDHSKWIELPGLLLLIASSAFTIWARIRLGRMWSASPDVLRADHELRTDGPYAITRHPIYTGLVGMLLGTALLNGLGVSLGFLLIGAAFLGARIPIEERLMSTAFPDEYARYRERVPLLVPGLHLLRRSLH
jgi:protein-S-isoprenylcysteine O-methyltransferase Ste14